MTTKGYHLMQDAAQNTNRVRKPKRDYTKPSLRRLGDFNEMTRTTTTSTLIPSQDLVTNTFYIS